MNPKALLCNAVDALWIQCMICLVYVNVIQPLYTNKKIYFPLVEIISTLLVFHSNKGLDHESGIKLID